jgi:hypothetical protein
VVRLIPDDSGFGLGNSGFNFGLRISVCGCTAECVTCHARPFSFVYFSDAIDKVTRRYSRRLSLLSQSEFIIGSEIKTGVSQSETGVIRNQTYHSYRIDIHFRFRSTRCKTMYSGVTGTFGPCSPWRSYHRCFFSACEIVFGFGFFNLIP